MMKALKSTTVNGGVIKRTIGHGKSREGCLTCKMKRIKCDLKKPSCTACDKRKIVCEYIVRLHWQVPNKQFKERLQLYYRCHEEIFITTEKPIVIHHFINFTYQDMDPRHSLEDSLLEPGYSTNTMKDFREIAFFAEERYQSLGEVQLTLFPELPERFMELPVPLEDLMDFFAKRIYPQLSVFGTLYNPMKYLFGFCQTSRSAYYAMLSVSGALLARTNNHINEEALALKSSSIMLLKQDMASKISTEVEVLVCLMLYCMFEMIQGSQKWFYYVRLAKQFMSRLSVYQVKGGYSDDSVKNLICCIKYFFAYHDLLDQSVRDDGMVVDSESWPKDDCIIPSIGCSSHLMYYISQTVNLVANKHNVGSAETISKGVELCHELESLKQVSPPFPAATEKDINGSNALVAVPMLAETKRKTVMLILQASVLNKSFEDEVITRLTLDIIDEIGLLLMLDVPKHLITWPLFLSACILPSSVAAGKSTDYDIESLRARMLNYVDELSSFSITNSLHVHKSILQVWRKRDMMMNKPEVHSVNDWTTYISAFAPNWPLT